VRLDVSVLDKSRRPVRGLGPADFTVLENGKPQSIAAFTPVDLPDLVPDPTGAPWLKNVASDVGGNADMQQRRLFILAIDDATIQNDSNAIKGVKDIARGVVNRLGPTDLMSVVFTRDNRGSQDFTSDRGRLLRAVDSFTVGFRDMGGGAGSPGAQMDELWYMYSVGMLERAIDFLADVPDRRKAIIYVGQGLPFDLEVAVNGISADLARASNPDSAGNLATQQMQMRVKDQMTDVFERANRSNVNVYTVDPCGLRVKIPPRVGSASGNIQPPPPTCQPGLEIDYLTQVAAATGGRPIINTNDFNPGLDAAFAENASYYLLGYQPTDQAHDGKFRKLEVLVNRPDSEIRTRTGYDAPREVSLARPKPLVGPLGKRLNGVVPARRFSAADRRGAVPPGGQ
jgi:VWFA-related protein